MRINYYILLLFLLSPVYPVSAQALKQLSGNVKSHETAVPLQGATILSTKNRLSTQTDSSGNFTIQVTPVDTLLVTHAGFVPTTVIITDTTKSLVLIALTITAKELGEVIVNTGYESFSKERSTGSFTRLDNALLSQQVSTGIMERLEAIAGGLSVGRKNNTTPNQLMIRGLSTINGPKDPLIILDNFPYEGNIANINPNDVETITLLKDAAAASIWGARAGNGVIVITTKKGKFSQPVQVELNTSVKITDAPDLFYYPLISTSDVIDVEQFLFNKGYRFSDTLSGERVPFSPVYEILFQQRNGQITHEEATARLNALRRYDVRDQFNRYFYQRAVNQQYALNVKGGSQTIAWLLSAGVDRNLSELSAAYNRVNFHSDNRIRLAPRLQLTTGIYFTQSKAISGKPGYGDIRQIKGGLPPYTQFADEQGNPLPFDKDYRRIYTDTAGAGKLLDWRYYPLEDYKHTRTTTRVQDIIANLGLNYSIVKGLTADLKYQYEKQQTDGRNLKDEQSYYARDMVNRFYQPGATGKFPVPQGGILDLSNTTLISQNIRGQLNFEKNWQRHALVAIAGGELRELRATAHSDRLYGYSDATGTFAKVDYANAYPSYVTGVQSFIESNQSIGEKLNRFVSVYANAAYTYRQRYTLSLSGRRDASNTFGIHTNDKWTPLWSAGASWDISKEPIYHFGTIPYLRMRATYGSSGNVDPSLSAVTTIHYSSINPYTQTPFAETDKFYNPDLRWEKSKQLNIGIDFKLRDGRIWGSLEYYRKKGTDLYGPALLDYTVGLGVPSITKNVAGMLATGGDIEINSLNLKGTFSWTTQLNLSFYKDKVTSYYLRSLQGSNFVGDGIGISGLEGKPVNAVFSYSWAGLDPLTGDPLGYDASKQPSKDYATLTGSGTSIHDLVYHGPAMPTAFGSLGNTFNWKGISLSVRLTYKFGHYFMRPSIKYNSLFSNLTGHADYNHRWQKPGDEAFTTVPSMVYPLVSAREAFYSNSAVLVEKADHVRLQYITLAYSLTNQQLKKLPIQAVQFYVNLNDLGLLWRANKHNLDPDYTITAIPPSKNIAMGVRINF